MTESDAEPTDSGRAHVRYLLVGTPGKPADASERSDAADGDANEDGCDANEDSDATEEDCAANEDGDAMENGDASSGSD